MELLVVNIPGLSVRLLRDHGDAAPEIARAGGEGSAAQLVVLKGASPAQLEAALLTGLLPKHVGKLEDSRRAPFWVAAGQRRQLAAQIHTALELPPQWRAADPDPQLLWRTVSTIQQAGPTRAALGAAEAECASLLLEAKAAVVLSAWSYGLSGRIAGQGCKPLDRPVLLIRGFEQPRSIVGILEVAGILERQLTGETLADRL